LSSEELVAEHRRITSRSKEDPGTAGDETECVWAETLRSWLPPYYPVVTKGRIVNEGGETSPQIDVMILNPAYPRKLVEKKTYLAGGVLAAFECKTTLRKRDMNKFFRNCTRIKALYRGAYGTIFKELFAPIYYACLALSYEGSTSVHSECVTLDRRIIRHPSEMPDAICIAAQEIILPAKSNIVFDKDWFEPAGDGKIPDLPINEPVWTANYRSRDQARPHLPLGLLFQSLYYWLGWSDEWVRNMHNFFEETGFRIDTGASLRTWPHSVYSQPVQDGFKHQANLTNGIRWSEWSVFYI
jgi:hypothetical protein